MVYKETSRYIFFWKPDGKYGFLSQWYRFPIGSFSCAEQYMMFSKALLFGDKDAAREISEAETPREMQKIGRKVKNFDQKTWDANKFKIVRNANIDKFRDPVLREKLLATGDKILAEASPFDKVWGIAVRMEDADIEFEPSWKGENLLGKALMEARDFWRKNKTIKEIIDESGLSDKEVEIMYRFTIRGETEDCLFGYCTYDPRKKVLIPSDGDDYSLNDYAYKYEVYDGNKLCVWYEAETL